jgi:S-DNA-T family DNA segregation ATPase FtsK/SpoIIIE
MATWGPSKKRDERALPARTTAPARTSSRSHGSGGSGSAGSGNVTRARYSRTDEAAARNRRSEASGELRRAVSGREHEFYGLLFVVGGVLLGLGLYGDIAGPLSDAVGWLVGLFFGLGRYLVPILLVIAGIGLIRAARTASPWRLAVGCALAALAALALLHIARGPDTAAGFSVNGVRDAGGVLGWALGEPTRRLLGDVGAGVLLAAVAAGGLLLLTQASLRTVAGNTGRGAAAVARPIGRAARRTLGNLSSLTSDNDPDHGGDEAVLGRTVIAEGDDPTVLALPPAGPRLYDGGDDDLADRAGDDQAVATSPAPAAPATRPAAAGSADGPSRWVLPPAALLHRTASQTVNRAEVEARGRVLQESLQQHGVDTSLVGMTVGPTVTRYELELGPGVKVARVTSLQKDIAYAMAAVDVRILAPIPGRSAIGVEVPNHSRQLVALGDLLTSPEATEFDGVLDVAIGKDIAGKAVFLDIATTPHLLIAGTTGSGKSSAINCVLTSLLMRTTPDQVRLILVDPKQVEMGQYNRLPHLLTQPVTNPKKAANALGWAVKEMERRYDVLSKEGFRDITGYNAAFDRGQLTAEMLPSGEIVNEPERLPYIVVVVDELNDLMMVAARDVEDSITRIAQKARAVGIHLIVATQRPSVNAITGVIKANIRPASPSRCRASPIPESSSTSPAPSGSSARATCSCCPATRPYPTACRARS